MNDMLNNNRIFIVHGHDEEMKQSVARTVEKQGLEAMILAEQISEGRTIIEKVIENSEAGYAIILLSPDDKGYCVNEKPKNARYRARQNVIFEWGYLSCKLGRERIMVLKKETMNQELEIFSDCAGVLYVPYDKYGSWKIRLLKELKSLGYQVDANKLI